MLPSYDLYKSWRFGAVRSLSTMMVEVKHFYIYWNLKSPNREKNPLIQPKWWERGNEKMSNGNPPYVTSFLKDLKKTKKMVRLEIILQCPNPKGCPKCVWISIQSNGCHSYNSWIIKNQLYIFFSRTRTLIIRG